ncbi:MAG: 1,6-anhydro-N-acetylmuramyl-L-alanine amidase AmpD [Ottowia sp.]|uniref:1,6-anhydro-N-acetylmuramyl-L-alanine amidase AmpD n=1 Tax=Ottowia sp. TaxID=1898956 RepID=UPI0039E638DA
MTAAEACAALWRAGWYRFAHALRSANHGIRPAGGDVSLIVVHSISLPPGEFGGDHVQALFTNRLDWDAHPYFRQIRGLEVSAHFYVRRDGALWQFVSGDDRAWHAGASCFQGRDNCNDYSVGIELEGLEGGRFEDAQYETLATLCTALAQRYPITHVAGHEHIAPGRKHDPGPGFDWGRLRRATGWPATRFPDAAATPPLA